MKDAKSTRKKHVGITTSDGTIKTGRGSAARDGIEQDRMTVTVNPSDSPRIDIRDEDIYWPGPESAEEIVVDVYSRR